MVAGEISECPPAACKLGPALASGATAGNGKEKNRELTCRRSHNITYSKDRFAKNSDQELGYHLDDIIKVGTVFGEQLHLLSVFM